ncbi:MAG: metallophosphoesterase [Phycisphaeraceae bacterium]
MPTIAHISDLHLQSGVPARQAQVEPILKKINEMKPELVVISGDVTDDGWDSIEELKWAKAWLNERIDREWFAVPGNHDVGNFADQKEGTITTKRVEAWNEVFGSQFDQLIWCKPKNHKKRDFYIDGWAIAGINSMLIGSGLASEKEQEHWLQSILDLHASGDSICVAVFLHSPLFVRMPDETNYSETSYWLGNAIKRYDIWSTMMQDGVELMGSGHVHQIKFDTIGEEEHRGAFPSGTRIAWAPPASGTWVHAPGLPNPPMPDQTGFFLHTLHDDGRVDSELIECAPMLKLYEHNP